MPKLIDEDEAIKVVHKVIYDYFDMVEDDDESPITYKDKQLLEINKKITQRIKALPSAQQWNIIKKTPMTEDERKEWSEKLGYDVEYNGAFIYSNLPDDGEDVIVCTQYNRVYIDTFCQDDGCYFEECGDMDGIVAWMPLPEPWKGEEND